MNRTTYKEDESRVYSLRIGRACAACIALVAAVLVVGACGGGSSDDPRGGGEPNAHHLAAQEDGLPSIVLPARWAWGDAERLDTLIASADVVFSGTVVALKGQRPALSLPGGREPGAAAPRFASLPVSQFDVRLDSVVSGSLTAGVRATVEQIGGVETRPDGTQVRTMLHGDAPLQVGAKYLFFGSFQEDGTITAPPFGRMKVQPDGGLLAESGWEQLGALEELSRGNLGDAEQQISVTADG